MSFSRPLYVELKIITKTDTFVTVDPHQNNC